MHYFIKITAKSGKEIVIDGIDNNKVRQSFKGLVIMSDTPAQNVKDRAANVLVKLQLDMIINSHTNGISKDLMDWSLSSKGEDVYRTVEVKVTDNENTLRTFSIPYMFVEDYSETYKSDTIEIDDESKEVDEGRFCLKLIQRAGETGSIEQLSE